MKHSVERSVAVNNNSPIQDYVHPDDQTQPTFEMTPGFKPFTVWLVTKRIELCNSGLKLLKMTYKGIENDLKWPKVMKKNDRNFPKLVILVVLKFGRFSTACALCSGGGLRFVLVAVLM